MSKSSENVKRWRNRTKELIVEAMGGCCQICSYNKCLNALELHHIDPLKKELSFGRMRANPVSIEKQAEELKKCILLCCLCHRELHANIICLPDSFKSFDTNFLIKTKEEVKSRHKNANIKRLSKGNNKKIFISNEKVYDLYINSFGSNALQLSIYLGVSEAAIRKRITKHRKNSAG